MDQDQSLIPVYLRYSWQTCHQNQTAQETGAWSKRRSQQQIRWMWSMVEDQLLHNLRNEASIAQTVSETEEQVLNGDLSATEAAKAILALFKESS